MKMQWEKRTATNWLDIGIWGHGRTIHILRFSWQTIKIKRGLDHESQKRKTPNNTSQISFPGVEFFFCKRRQKKCLFFIWDACSDVFVTLTGMDKYIAWPGAVVCRELVGGSGEVKPQEKKPSKGGFGNHKRPYWLQKKICVWLLSEQTGRCDIISAPETHNGQFDDCGDFRCKRVVHSDSFHEWTTTWLSTLIRTALFPSVTTPVNGGGCHFSALNLPRFAVLNANCIQIWKWETGCQSFDSLINFQWKMRLLSRGLIITWRKYSLSIKFGNIVVMDLLKWLCWIKWLPFCTENEVTPAFIDWLVGNVPTLSFCGVKISVPVLCAEKQQSQAPFRANNNIQHSPLSFSPPPPWEIDDLFTEENGDVYGTFSRLCCYPVFTLTAMLSPVGRTSKEDDWHTCVCFICWNIGSNQPGPRDSTALPVLSVQ